MVFRMKMKLPKDYPYLYETHLHTSQASACGIDLGSEMAKACKEAGYAGIIVTDHNWGGNTSGYQGTEFLIYGVDKEFMLAHEELRRASVEEQYALIHGAGGMVIHAHPFREEYYIPEIRLFPEHVDGVEGINATHSNSRSKAHNEKVFDERAIDYARKYKFPLTAGSDIHRTDLLGGGMAFRRKLDSIHDFIRAVLDGEDYLLTNGEEWFTKEGVEISSKIRF